MQEVNISEFLHLMYVDISIKLLGDGRLSDWLTLILRTKTRDYLLEF